MKNNKNTKEVINLIWTAEKDINSKPIATRSGKGSSKGDSGDGNGGGCGSCSIACCCSVPNIFTKWLCN